MRRMTLNDIIVSALAQLDRGHDSQTVDTWRDKLTRYANEAVTDLATVLQLRRSDPLNVSAGIADIAQLPRCCCKVLFVSRGMARVPFITGPSSTRVRVLCDDGAVIVHYRYLPDDMSSPTDVPELPGFCHGMVVTYVVARERASADPSMQRAANVYFELYSAGKRSLRASLGEPDRCRFENRW